MRKPPPETAAAAAAATPSTQSAEAEHVDLDQEAKAAPALIEAEHGSTRNTTASAEVEHGGTTAAADTTSSSTRLSLLQDLLKARAVEGVQIYINLYQEPPLTLALDSLFQVSWSWYAYA